MEHKDQPGRTVRGLHSFYAAHFPTLRGEGARILECVTFTAPLLGQPDLGGDPDTPVQDAQMVDVLMK